MFWDISICRGIMYSVDRNVQWNIAIKVSLAARKSDRNSEVTVEYCYINLLLQKCWDCPEFNLITGWLLY